MHSFQFQRAKRLPLFWLWQPKSAVAPNRISVTVLWNTLQLHFRGKYFIDFFFNKTKFVISKFQTN